MEITLANIKPGTVIVVNNKLAIVEEVKASRPKNPIAYKNNTDHRGYICRLEQVQTILGDVDLTAWQNASTRVETPRAARDDSWAMPQNLRDMDLKIGDTVTIRTRRGTEEAIYGGYNANRPKNPLSLTVNGRDCKGPASLLVGKVRDGQAAA